MDQSSSSRVKKGNEKDVIDVVSWLKTELAGAEKLKKEKILEAANRLKELGFRKDWIASTLAEYSNDLGVSRGYLYEALPDEFKNKKRSVAQKEAKAAKILSQIPDLEAGEPQEIMVGSDGNSFADTSGDDGEGATKSWMDASELRNKTLDEWLPVVNSVIQTAIIEGDFVRVPKDVWEQFTTIINQLG